MGASTPSQSTCFGGACTWTFYLSSAGVMTDVGTSTPGTPGAGAKVGYDSTPALGRVCIPSTAVFTSASFTAITSSFSAAINQGDLSSFIEDIKNVNYQPKIELEMAPCSIWIFDCGIFHFYVDFKMFSRMHSLDFPDRNSVCVGWPRSPILIQRRGNWWKLSCFSGWLPRSPEDNRHLQFDYWMGPHWTRRILPNRHALLLQ